MKVLQIASDYYNTSVYGNLFNELEKSIELEVLVPLTKDNIQHYIDKINPKNVTSVFLGKSQIFGIQINSSKFAKHVITSGLSNGINLIHAHYVLNDGSTALKLHHKLGIPYVVSIRASCLMSFDRKLALHNYLNGLNVLKYAKAIIFQTPNALDVLLQRVPESYRSRLIKKHIIIPNGIDKFWHDNAILKSKSLVKNEFTVITVASIEHNKNLLRVAEAISNLNSRGYSIRYNIAGAVINESILTKLIRIPQVYYLGILDKNILLEYYKQSDIFIMVSHNETFGLVYPEAMSQGLPLIYTKGEGFDGQFEEGLVGYHATSNSIIEIEQAILKILKNFENLSSNSIKNVIKFDWNKIADKYCSIYSQMLAK